MHENYGNRMYFRNTFISMQIFDVRIVEKINKHNKSQKLRKKIYWYNHISWTEIFKKNLEHTKCFLYAYRQATNFIKPCLKNLQNKKKFSNTIWKEAIFSASSLDIFHTTQNVFKVRYVISKYIMRNVLFSVISLTYKYFRTSQIKNCRNTKKVCICHNCYDNLLTWKWNMLENARKSCRMLWFFTKTTCTKNELPKSLKIIKTRLISMPRRKAISWCEAQVNIADAAVHVLCSVLSFW